MTRVLVLAGSYEARAFIGLVQGRVEVIASLAGATREPRDLGVPTRVGGFGGVEAMAAWLRAEAIDAVVDATHPFAARMTWNAYEACKKAEVPHVILQRRGWKPQAGDNWHFVEQFEEVEKIIPMGATVFLGTGRQTLDQFSGLSGRRLLCRVIDPPQRAFPFAGGRFVVGCPPFSVAEEVAFFKEEGVEWLVVKNAGGQRSRSKLDAARHLGLPVVMQKRPLRPDAEVVWSETDCIAWLDSLCG